MVAPGTVCVPRYAGNVFEIVVNAAALTPSLYDPSLITLAVPSCICAVKVGIDDGLNCMLLSIQSGMLVL